MEWDVGGPFFFHQSHRGMWDDWSIFEGYPGKINIGYSGWESKRWEWMIGIYPKGSIYTKNRDLWCLSVVVHFNSW